MTGCEGSLKASTAWSKPAMSRIRLLTVPFLDETLCVSAVNGVCIYVALQLAPLFSVSMSMTFLPPPLPQQKMTISQTSLSPDSKSLSSALPNLHLESPSHITMLPALSPYPKQCLSIRLSISSTKLTPTPARCLWLQGLSSDALIKAFLFYLKWLNGVPEPLTMLSLVPSITLLSAPALTSCLPWASSPPTWTATPQSTSLPQFTCYTT